MKGVYEVRNPQPETYPYVQKNPAYYTPDRRLHGRLRDQQAARKTFQVQPRLAVGSIHTVRTTAYTSSEPGGGHSACGTRLCGSDKKGSVKSAASDWSRFPLGTKFQIVSTGEIYEVCDYGSALVGKNTIDLYKCSRKEMRKLGARHVDIKILALGLPGKEPCRCSPRASTFQARPLHARRPARTNVIVIPFFEARIGKYQSAASP